MNSSNVEQLRGLECLQVVCCGLPGEKWRANADPVADQLALSRLIDPLKTATAKEFILISTIDVYGNRRGDEATNPKPWDVYGQHRKIMELFVGGRWPNARIIRLPAIYGAGLRKNVLFDLLHEHRLDHVNPLSRFQWFSLARLRAIVDAPGPPLLNLATEPVQVSELLERFFPQLRVGGLDPPANYDVRSRHCIGDYYQNRDEVLSELRDFISNYRVGQSEVPDLRGTDAEQPAIA